MPDSSSFEFGPFRLDAEKGVLWRSGELVPLTPKALALLLALVEHRGDVVSKEELLGRVWPDAAVEEANLSVTVSALRRALGPQPDGRSYLQTVPRRGYRFDAEVKAEAEARRHELGLAVLAVHLPRPGDRDPPRPRPGRCPDRPADRGRRAPGAAHGCRGRVRGHPEATAGGREGAGSGRRRDRHHPARRRPRAGLRPARSPTRGAPAVGPLLRHRLDRPLLGPGRAGRARGRGAVAPTGSRS